MERYIEVNQELRDAEDVKEFQASLGDVFDVQFFLENCDVADVAPVVHGRWLLFDDVLSTLWQCSACKVLGRKDWNYCPFCGAKMDLEESDGD